MALFGKCHFTGIVYACAISLMIAPAAVAAEPVWTSAEQEAVALLSRYIRIDTTNPPGNEIKAAQFFKRSSIAKVSNRKSSSLRPGAEMSLPA